MSPVTWIAPDKTRHEAKGVTADGTWWCICGHHEDGVQDVVAALRKHLESVGAA